MILVHVSGREGSDGPEDAFVVAVGGPDDDGSDATAFDVGDAGDCAGPEGVGAGMEPGAADDGDDGPFGQGGGKPRGVWGTLDDAWNGVFCQSLLDDRPHADGGGSLDANGRRRHVGLLLGGTFRPGLVQEPERLSCPLNHGLSFRRT